MNYAQMNDDKIKLMAHQVEGVARGAKEPRYGFWLDCGTGKTLTMLALLNASKNARDAAARVSEVFSVASAKADVQGRWIVPPQYMPTVVVCPKAIIKNAWLLDAKHYPALRVESAWDQGELKRRERIRGTSGVDVWIINFENFKQHRRDFYDMGVRRLIIDESSKLKNHASQIAKACIEFSDYMQSVYLLSGTPAPNSEIEYWAQMRCIDKQIFGDSFYRFANEYFAPQKRNIKGRQVVLGYRMLSQKRDDFFNRLSIKTWSLK